MSKGWKGESRRHSMSSKGVKTTNKTNKNLSGIQIKALEISKLLEKELNLEINSVEPLVTNIHFNRVGYIVDEKYGTYYVFEFMDDAEEYAKEFLMETEELTEEEAEDVINCDVVEMSLTTSQNAIYIGEIEGYLVYKI